MPERLKNEDISYAVFDSLPTNALEEILRADAQQPEYMDNLDAVLYISALLDKRAAAAGEYVYDARANMPDFETLLDSAAEQKPAAGQKPGRKRKNVLRTALMAAVICVLLFLMTGVAAAVFGINVWNIIGTWTDETFTYRKMEQAEAPETGAQHLHDLEALQNGLEDCGITEFHAPTWLPEGYELEQLVVDVEPSHQFLRAIFRTADGVCLSISVEGYQGVPGSVYEKTGEEAETMVIGDTRLYVFSNKNNHTIAWYTGQYSCSISGLESREDLKKIVESMFA